MTAPDLPCSHHKQSETISTVVLRSYLKEIFPPSLTTSSFATLMNHKDTSALQKIDISNSDWELDSMLSLWNSAVRDISDWIQVVRNLQ